MKIRIQTGVSVVATLGSLCLVGCPRSTYVINQEKFLRSELSVLRSAIDRYTLDQQKAPQRLEDLVKVGYLKVLVEEPTTGRTDCWVTVQEDSMMAIDQNQPGIVDVHSCNDQLASDGTAYSSW